MDDEVVRLQRAINHAVSVIQAYEAELHNTPVLGDDGSTLADLGFCQGTIFTNAIPTIANIAGVDVKLITGPY